MFDRLTAPFPPERVSWRVGSTNGDKTRGMALAYIDARDVMDRLDEVCGPSGWQCRYPHANGKTVCEIGILITREHRTPGAGPGGCTQVDETAEWVWKADGAGDTDYEAEKGALSDAFKRAAVRWGIGRYLYDLDSPWVAVEVRGKTAIIKDEEKPRLAALLRRGVAHTPTSSTPIHERGLFVACKAAMDLCEGKAAMESWAKDNAVSMERIKTEDPEVYSAVRNYYAKRLLAFTEQKAAA